LRSCTAVAIIIFLFLFLPPAQILNAQSNLDSTTFQNYEKISKQIVTSALKERKGYDILKNLCRIGPRLSGSRNSLIAINWAKFKMKELGFDSVWLQSVMVPHWERGEVEEVVILDVKTKAEKKLNVLSLGGSIGTPVEGITANVLEVKSFEELKNRKDEAIGKIIFFSRPIDQSMKNTFSAYGEAADQRVYGAIEAAKVGAIGVIVRSLTTKFDNIPHTGMMKYEEKVKQIPAVAIGYLDADYLSQILEDDPELKVRMKLDCKTLPDEQSFNVIGEIRGIKFPDEIIVVGGHFDSWDVGDGAHDDGVGCIQAIEVLDLFKRLSIKPKRTIRAVLFINEENGSKGGLEYGKFADISKQIHYAAIESDRGAFTPIGFYLDTDSTELIDRVRSWLPFLNYSRINWIKKGGSGVDVSKIKNVKLKIGYYPDDQRYFDFHHSPADVFEAVHPREFELGSAAMAILTFLLSEEGL